MYQRRDKPFASRTSDRLDMFDRFRRPGFSDSPDQVVWENLRNESVDTVVSARSRRALIYLRLLRLILPDSSGDCRAGAETGRKNLAASRGRPVS